MAVISLCEKVSNLLAPENCMEDYTCYEHHIYNIYKHTHIDTKVLLDRIEKVEYFFFHEKESNYL